MRTEVRNAHGTWERDRFLAIKPCAHSSPVCLPRWSLGSARALAVQSESLVLASWDVGRPGGLAALRSGQWPSADDGGPDSHIPGFPRVRVVRAAPTDPDGDVELEHHG